MEYFILPYLGHTKLAKKQVTSTRSTKLNNRYNLQKRQSTSYKEVKDYKPRSNSRTDKKSKDNDSAKKSCTEESFENHINIINSLRMENSLSYTENRKL